MAKFCNSEQHCKDCRWYQIDDEESAFYGEYRYVCVAVPDKNSNVKFEPKEENNG